MDKTGGELVKPFQAFFYNTDKFGDFAALACPPYDVMGEKEKEYFQARSKYNFSRVLLTDRENDYKSLARRFNQWIDDRVMVRDAGDCFYLYEQKFDCLSEEHTRVGFLGALRLDAEGMIHPHENTFKAPRQDRWNILNELKANMSPVFVIAPEKINSLQSIYNRKLTEKPFIEFKDEAGITNRLWRIVGREETRSLSGEMRDSKLFIADGHHRFSVAYDYYCLNRGKYKDLNYTMAYFTDSSPGLLVLPTHRVVNLPGGIEAVRNALSPLFSVKEIQEEDLETEREKAGGFCFGLYYGDKFYFFELKDESGLDKVFVTREDRIYRKLDVCVLHRFVFEELKSRGVDIGDIEYVHRVEEVKDLAREDKTGFLVKAVSLETVFTFAREGLLFPQKTTYFYPKVLSGLVVRRLES